MVAEAAGVSRGTASRALNGSPNVSAKALEAVERAAAALGYRPNLAARSLALGRSESIGLVVSETDERLFGDPFFATLVRGVHDELAQTGTQLVLTLAQTAAERERVVRFAPGRLDGVLVISAHGDDPLPQALEDAGIPVVTAGRIGEHPADEATGDDAPWWVDADNHGGAILATRHLVAAGRTRIGTVTGPLDMAVGRDRLRGWRDALAEAGLSDERVVHGDFSEASGERAMRELLQRFPDVDAVFVASDLMAVGALPVLKEAGRSVPGDVALVGYDDIPAARRSDPPLTTVAQPVDRLGRVMVRLVLARARGEAVAEHEVVLPVQLVVRGSA